MEAVVTCVKCKAPLVSAEGAGVANVSFNTGRIERCPSCGARTAVEVFPAIYRPFSDGRAAEKIASVEEAACFYHPQKRASVPCDACGRFLCALCDVELSGQHLCPNCIQSGKKKGRLRNLENERVLYDRIALTASLLPLFMWPFTVITAPIALYLSIRHWKSPTSIVPRFSRVRFSFAIFFSLLQIAGWVILIGYLIHKA